MLKYGLVFVFAVFIASCAQIMLKISAGREYKNPLFEYFNMYVISAYSIILISVLMTIYAYRGIELRFTPMLDALAYVFVPLLSVVILKERLSARNILGVMVIVVGMILFGAIR